MYSFQGNVFLLSQFFNFVVGCSSATDQKCKSSIKFSCKNFFSVFEKNKKVEKPKQNVNVVSGLSSLWRLGICRLSNSFLRIGQIYWMNDSVEMDTETLHQLTRGKLYFSSGISLQNSIRTGSRMIQKLISWFKFPEGTFKLEQIK